MFQDITRFLKNSAVTTIGQASCRCWRVSSSAQNATSEKKKRRSATAPTWRMGDDSTSPRNSDPPVVSQTLPWGMTQTDLKFKFCLHKYVQKVCYLILTSVGGGETFSISRFKKCGEFKLTLISWIDWWVITLTHIFVWSFFSVTEICEEICIINQWSAPR